MKPLYPRPDRAPADAFGPVTLRLATAQILSWRQGAGSVGGLHLHACWGVSSALSRRYHGETIANLALIHDGARRLARGADGPRWRHFADNLAAEMLWLQAPKGGFIHASGEGEPTYDSYWSCPIHQMLPVLALLDHYEDQPAGAPVRGEIEAVLARHLGWFARFWWKRGNDWRRPLPFPGWCGVANQDLVAVAALARHGQVFGDWRPFETHGLPALETCLGPRYFHAELGLFERGDRAAFSERTSYLVLIARMLAIIHAARPDARIPRVLDLLGETIADAVFVDDQGCHHMAWGVDDAETRRLGRRVWLREKLQLSDYPALIDFLAARPDARKPALAAKIAGLEKTLATYVFADGTIPTALDPAVPLFAIAPSATSLHEFWRFLVRRHPAGLAWNDVPALPSVSRRCGSFLYVANDQGWLIREEGAPALRGVKRLSHGVLRPGEEWANCNFEPPADPDHHEEIALAAPAPAR